MASENIGEDYLDAIDSLNLEKPEHRRVALRALEDFYGENLTFIIKYRFESGNIDSSNIGVLWGRVKGELKATLQNFEIPEKFSGLIHKLQTQRNRVSHDYTEGISIEDVEYFLGIAEEWRSWIQECAQDVAREKDPITDKDWLERRINSTIEHYQSVELEAKYLKNMKEREFESLKDVKRRFLQIENTEEIRPGRIGNLHSNLDSHEDRLEYLKEADESIKKIREGPKEKRTYKCEISSFEDTKEGNKPAKVFLNSQEGEKFLGSWLIPPVTDAEIVELFLNELEVGDEVKATLHIEPFEGRGTIIEDIQLVD